MLPNIITETKTAVCIPIGFNLQKLLPPIDWKLQLTSSTNAEIIKKTAT